MLFRNFYRCANCGHEWEDVWSAMCDDDCPHCGAGYKLVRVDVTPPASVEREITCRKCGASLHGREGRYILKYFLVKGPRTQATVARLS